MSKLLYLHANQVDVIQEGKRYFIKTFLIDNSINQNRWAVTEVAVRKDIASFIGKPVVMTENFDHPASLDGDTLLQDQEAYRVGTIIDVGVDDLSGKGWAMAEITKQEAIDFLQATAITFISPSIIFGQEDLIIQNGTELVTHFEGAHFALVKDPAYGMQKAQVKGKCAGSPTTCFQQLLSVQASVEDADEDITYAGFKSLRDCVEANLDTEDDPLGYCMMKREVKKATPEMGVKRSKCGKYITIKQGSKQWILQASPCVEKCLREKSDKGIEIDDQAIAICFSECGESRESNIDPTSLENITQIDLIKKKDSECLVDQLGNCVTHRDSSVKCSIAQKQVMTSQTEEEKREEAKKAQEEKEKKDEEARRSQEEEDEKKAQEEEEKEKARKAQEEEDEKKEAQEKEEKEKKVDDIAKLRAELDDIKEKMNESRKEAEAGPIVDKIVSAKVRLNQIKESDSKKERESLMEVPTETLSQIATEYEKFGTTKERPYSVIAYQASRETAEGDEFLQELGSSD